MIFDAVVEAFLQHRVGSAMLGLQQITRAAAECLKRRKGDHYF